MPKRDPEDPDKPPSDLFTSAETRAMLEEFRELVREGVLQITPENQVLSVKQPPGSRSGEPRVEAPAFSEEEVRYFNQRVMERIERSREAAREGAAAVEQPEGKQRAALKLRQEVVERVAQRILENWEKAEREGGGRQTLREDVILQLVRDVLRRWEPDLR